MRLPGFLWGLPGPTHLFSYHPDEFHSLRGLLSLTQGDLNPHFFNYGCLYLYGVAAVGTLIHPSLVVGHLSPATNPAYLPLALRVWTVDARLVSLLAGLASVLVVASAAQALGANGLWAGLTLAFMPLHALHCRYATVDVTLTLFVALAVWATVRGKVLGAARARLYVWAGVFAGLAASTKYTGAVALLVPLAALVLDGSLGNTRRRLGLSFACAGAALLAFALTSPYVFLGWSEASRDIFFEMQHMRAGEYPARAAEPSGLWFHAKWLTLGTAGLAPLGLVALLVAAAATRGSRAHWFPAVLLAVVILVMISSTGVRYARYEMPLLPLAALGIGWLAGSKRSRPDGADADEAVQDTLPASERLELPAQPVNAARRAALGLALALLVAAAVHCLWLCLRLRAPDSRDVALRELVRRAEPSETVGVIWEPWFQGPPLDYCNGGQALRRNPFWRQFSRPVRPLVVVGYDVRVLYRERPDWFALSEVEERDFRRVGASPELWQALDAAYEPVGAWGKRPSEGLVPPSLNPPQDWLYPTMPIAVLRARAAANNAPRPTAPAQDSPPAPDMEG